MYSTDDLLSSSGANIDLLSGNTCWGTVRGQQLPAERRISPGGSRAGSQSQNPSHHPGLGAGWAGDCGKAGPW